MSPPASPWLTIPAGDYEAHMSAVGQAAALRGIFSRVYRETRPARVAILGCTTGSDLLQVDPAGTETVVGVDINPDYLEIARRRLTAFGSRLHLIHADVLRAELPPVGFDLVHAALLLEYVDAPSLFRRVVDWLAPRGALSLVNQEPAVGVAAVSPTPYTSLQPLAAHMTLRSAAEVVGLADCAGLRLVRTRAVKLSSGKILTSSVFGRGAS